MPPQTRSRTRTAQAAPKETTAVKSGATRKSASKTKPKAPPKKKARKDQLSAKEETQKLLVLHFANLPLELFLEIAKHLNPLDLIHLSRSNKLLRSMFMRRPAAEVWRAALANAGLPPCPDQPMSEPRYAALMFLEQCSECCKPATRHMDPIFLVRLCYACRKRMVLSANAVGRLASVLTHSQYLVPPRGKAKPNWYLLREYEEINNIISDVEVGDQNVWKDWFDGRVALIRARHKEAQPLIQWLEKKDEEQKQAIIDLKNARAAQVESRLLKLGWQLADIREGENHCAEWRSLVYKVKPLNNTDWKDMRPYLLDGLEKAREERFRQERHDRAEDRERIVDNWLLALPDQLGPADLTLRWRESGTCSTSRATETSCASNYPEGVEKKDITIHIPPIPSKYDLKTNCPHLRELLGTDTPTEEFRVKFEEKQIFLKEQYSAWRTNLEASLVKTLPADLKPVETQNSDFDLMSVAQLKADDSEKLKDRLSMDLRVLLRADVRFKYSVATFHFSYPNHFDRLGSDWSGPMYDEASARVAKAILRELQRPDASYLEMRALGKSFLCTRCIDDPKYYEWDEIVGHYIEEDVIWRQVELSKQTRAEGKDITILPTHGLDAHEKPLIRLVAKEEQVPSVKAPRSDCEVCFIIRHRYRTGATHIARHVREVHLIEDPVLGEHYTEGSRSYWY